MIDEVDLRSRVGPILSDGTPLRSLIDLERREFSIRVLSDPEIHGLELRRCFGKAWVPIAHTAELKKAGDFRVRYIGEDRVLVTRDADGGYNVLLNACSHRGMEICRAHEGNQASFKCPFHGWTFDPTGRLLGAPFEKLMYGDWDKLEYGLVTARVEVRSGIIFASFDQNGPSLDEYLGEDMGWYLDFNLGDVDPDDLVATSGPLGGGSSFRIPANWKTLAEQLIGDGYHGVTLHAGMVELFGSFSGSFSGSIGVGTKNGHIVYTYDGQARMKGEPNNYDLLSEGQSYRRVVFPFGQVMGGAVGGGTGKRVSIGGFAPKGPNAYETWQVDVEPKTAKTKKMRGLVEQKDSVQGNIANLIGADDMQQGPSIQRVAQGYVAQSQLTMKYNARYPGAEVRPEDFKGPQGGIVHVGVPRDDTMWKFWTKWFDVMTQDD